MHIVYKKTVDEIMANQKLEDMLELALGTDEALRARSEQLNVGYSETDRTWELIVKYNGDIERLQSNVIRVEGLIAGYAIVTLPESLIESFTELEEVEYVEKPKRLYFSSLAGKQASCVFQVTEETPFLTGEGVLVAIVDSGIDYKNPEFLDREGNTRIRFLWDQTLMPENVDTGVTGEGVETPAPPTGFFEGVEFSAEQINAALQSRNPERSVPSIDSSGHGTAVAAIAAASGNLAEGRYRGVAPECELLVVKMGTPAPDSFPKTTELMRAVTYVVNKAVELGMPLVVNLSFGNTYGSHNGTSLVERFLDNAAEVGRTVICVGSGNEGAAGGHVAGSFLTAGGQQAAGASIFPNVGSREAAEEADDRRRIELSVDNYQGSFSVQLWKEYTDEFSVIIISPAGEKVTLQQGAVGGRSYLLEETEILVYQGEPSPYSVSQEFYFDFLPVESYVNQGIWTFMIEPIETVVGNYDFYLPSSNVLNSGTRFFTPSPDKTLTIPSTSSKVITVGAYDVRTEGYADFSGRGYPLSSRMQERLATVSIKPDLVAPGVDIQTIGPEGGFVTVSGTSFATPFVTGSAALLMEWGIIRGNDRFLYGEKVKAYLRKGARPIRGERIYPNDKVGYGALCIAESLPI